MDELRIWLAGEGFPGAADLTAMKRGLGSTELWSFRPGPGESRLVARVFPEGAFRGAEREAMAMHAAAAHGLPVPEVVARGSIGDRPVLVTTFAAGEPAMHVLAARPERAFAVGRAMGEVLGRLHRVRVPEGVAAPGAWIDRAGDAIEPLRQALAAVPGQDRLLHLDYHPLNVLMDGGDVSGVIDWENTMPGPAHMDLARSRAILRAIAIARPEDAVIRDLDRGLVEGHAASFGPDPHPDLSRAWGLSMTVDDLAQQAGKPGSPVSQDVLAQLAEERDALIGALS